MLIDMISRPRHGAGAALSNFYSLSSLSALYSSPNKSEAEEPAAHEEFAENILDLELQLQHNCTFPLINALMQAYSVFPTQRAIEHYECLQDPKHVQLQERMHAFLARKDVMSVLRPSPKPLISTLELSTEDSDTHKKSHSMQLLEQLQVSDSSPKQQDLPKQRKAEKLISRAHLEVKAAVTNVHADLKQQNEQLRHRLESRKERSASLTRNERVHTEGHDGECDEEEARRPRACYEDDLESLVEELVRKRQRERLEVEEKYSSQMKELEGYSKGGNSLIARVIEELNRSRDKEIAALESRITQERAKAIADLKSKHMRGIF